MAQPAPAHAPRGPGGRRGTTALLDELAPATDQGKGSVTSTFSGGVQHGTFIQAGNIGRLTVGEPPR